MAKFKDKYRIESNRARFWNYSDPGDYFITICIYGRENILGHIENGVMILSEYGKIVESEIKKIPQYHKRVIMDVWVVMPNHVHLIVTLGGYNFDNGISTVGDNDNNPVDGVNPDDTGHAPVDDANPVEEIHEFPLRDWGRGRPNRDWERGRWGRERNQWWYDPDYKPTDDEIKQYRKQRRKMLIPKILGKFQQQTSKQINILRNTPGMKNWQPNYYDHIIRNPKSYRNIKKYIINNPVRWNNDNFNPGNHNSDK